MIINYILITILILTGFESINYFINFFMQIKELILYKEISHQKLHCKISNDHVENIKNYLNNKYNKKNNLVYLLIPFYYSIDYVKMKNFLKKELENSNDKHINPIKNNKGLYPLKTYSNKIINVTNYEYIPNTTQETFDNNLENEKGFKKVKRKK